MSNFSEGYLKITTGEQPYTAPIEVYECSERPQTEASFLLLRLPALLKKSQETTMGIYNGK